MSRFGGWPQNWGSFREGAGTARESVVLLPGRPQRRGPNVKRSRDPFEHPELLVRRVYAYVAYRIGDGPDAEDITSDTFERALRYRKSYDPRKGDAVSWLIGIARRRIADRRSPFTARPQPDETMALDRLEEETLERISLSAAVAELEPRDRELIALRYGADLTAREIGKILGISTNAAEVALHRALARLRRILEETTDDESPPASSVRL
jgi:RNA polymerase sigma-70 factor (ECF subfamily)